jgi:hypothetical protein
LRQIDRGEESDRAGTDNNDRMSRRLALILIGGPPVAELEETRARLSRHFHPRVEPLF